MSDFINITRNNNDIISTYSANPDSEGEVGEGGLVAQLAQKVSQTELSINPDSYTGTDLQKLQSAFNDAYTYKRAIRLNRLYDITGGTIQINKPADPDRTPIYTKGENGGGIKKTDSGFWFTSPNALTGDLFFTGILFQGLNNSGSTIFDGDKLIRIFSSQNSYHQCDNIISSTNFVQTLRFINDRIIDGRGTSFNSPDYYDTVIEGCLAERGKNFFNVNGPNGAFGVRIMNNCIEGLSGTAIHMVNNNHMVIANNYFEANVGGHIVFDAAGYGGETVITGNWHGASAESGVTALIVWPVNPGKSVAIGNYTQNGMLIHDYSNMTNLGNGGRVLAIDPSTTTFGNKGVVNVGYSSKTTDGTTGAATTAWGYVNKIYNSKSVTVTNGTSQTVTVAMPVSINTDDFISVTISSNANIKVRNYYGNGLNVNVNVENDDTTSQTFTVNVVVIKVLT